VVKRHAQVQNLPFGIHIPLSEEAEWRCSQQPHPTIAPECKRRQTCHYRLKCETGAKERRGSKAGRQMAARVQVARAR
jgi:hypothetical protein